MLVFALLSALSCTPSTQKPLLALDQRLVEEPSEETLEVSEDDRAPKHGRAWRCDLDGDVRTGMPTPPGHPLVREASLRRGSVLHFAYGLKPGPQVFRGALTFRIRAVAFDGGEETLFETRVTDGEVGRGWFEGVADLARYGEGPVRLTFEVDGDAPVDPVHGVPVWAAPRIVAPRDTSDLRPNIALISLDTLRADHLSLYGYQRETSPAIDAWAKSSGVVFEQAVTQASWTLPAHASLFTGLDSLRHGANYGRAVSPQIELLAERLGAAGYLTYATTGGVVLHPRFGLSQGFDVYRYATESTKRDELERSVEQTCDWMREGLPEPFFLFLHTYEVHTPYRPREPFFSRFGGDPKDTKDIHVRVRALPNEPKRGLVLEKEFVLYRKNKPAGVMTDPEVVSRYYDAGVAYTDQQIGRVLATLQELGLDRRTVVVLTSDHGESLLDHGLADHGYLFDDNLLVPLVLALPDGRAKGNRVPQQVRLVDVPPTLLELAKLRVPEGMDGSSLLPLLDSNPSAPSRPAWSYGASSNYGISLRLDNRLKYIFQNAVWEPIRGAEQLYRLDQDPGEIADLSQTSPRDVERLRPQVAQRLHQRTTGIRVRLSNANDMTLRGELRGPLIKMYGVTSPDLDHDGVIWHGGGLVETMVPPGKAFTVMLEDVGSNGFLKITGRLSGDAEELVQGHSFTLSIDLAQLSGVGGMVFEAGSWRALAATDPPPGTGVAVWWGPRLGHGRTVAEEDQRLQDQLRALGYLE